jgi:Gly-Xaa carboxypeptidase
VDETKVHIHNILAPLARKWGFSYKAFGHEVYPALLDGSHHITLDIQSNGKSKPVGLEPAPITPSNNDAFDLMAGTIKGVFGNHTVVAPSGMFGEFMRYPGALCVAYVSLTVYP